LIRADSWYEADAPERCRAEVLLELANADGR